MAEQGLRRQKGLRRHEKAKKAPTNKTFIAIIALLEPSISLLQPYL